MCEEAFDYDSYCKNMRQALSNSDITTKEGGINHAYFLAKKGQYWSPEHQASLVKGIGLYGIGKWDKIKFYEFNDKANEVELELRTCILLGINTLEKYQDMKLSEEEIVQEKENNLKLAKEANKLKNGMLNL